MPTKDYDPFLDDPDEEFAIFKVKPVELANINFTITGITREQTLNDLYHDYKWVIDVETVNEQRYAFDMNPSKKRNELLNRLQSELPKQNMTLEQKQFNEQRTGKLITYYELTNYVSPVANSTQEPKKRKRSA